VSDSELQPWTRGQWAITFALLLAMVAPLAYGVWMDYRDGRAVQRLAEESRIEEAKCLRGLALMEQERIEAMKRYYLAEAKRIERGAK